MLFVLLSCLASRGTCKQDRPAAQLLPPNTIPPYICLFSRLSCTAFLMSRYLSWQLARHDCSFPSSLSPLVPAHLAKHVCVMFWTITCMICWLAWTCACCIMADFWSGVRFCSAAGSMAAFGALQDYWVGRVGIFQGVLELIKSCYFRSSCFHAASILGMRGRGENDRTNGMAAPRRDGKR